MGRTKIKFNIDDLFLEGQHSSTEKQAFIRSPLFSIMTTIYNTTDKTVRVGQIISNQISTSADPKDTIMSAVITTPEGLSVGKLRCNRGTYDYVSTSDGMIDPAANTLISTTSANYIRSKLSKNSEHVAASWLRRCAADGIHCISNAIRSVTDSLTDRAYGRSIVARPSIEFSSEVGTFLANVAMGNLTMMQMPADIRHEFETKYSEYTNNSKKFYAAIDAAKNFFDQGKWVLIRNINAGVVLGAISPDGAVAGLDIYRNGTGLPHGEINNYAHFTMRPKWYPSYEAIPDEYRRELDYALMVLKVHRNADTLFPNSERDVWTDIGAASWGKMLLLPR